MFSIADNTCDLRHRFPLPVTRTPPTGPMLGEATAAGRFEDGFGRTYPRLQILTIADLFAGRKPDIPYPDPNAAFRRATREDTVKQGSLL